MAGRPNRPASVRQGSTPRSGAPSPGSSSSDRSHERLKQPERARATHLGGKTIWLVGLGARGAADVRAVVERVLQDAPPSTVFVPLLDLSERTTTGERIVLEAVTAANAQGRAFQPFPITDGSVPASLVATGALIASLQTKEGVPRPVLFGCHAGCGRSGMLAACVLVSKGRSVGQAINLVERARRRTIRDLLTSSAPIIETAEQILFVERFARMWAVVEGGPRWQRRLVDPVSSLIEPPQREDVADAIDRLTGNGTLESFVHALMTLAMFDWKGWRRSEIVGLGQRLRDLVPGFETGQLRLGDSPQGHRPVGKQLIGEVVQLASLLSYAYSRPELLNSGFEEVFPANDSEQPEDRSGEPITTRLDRESSELAEGAQRLDELLAGGIGAAEASSGQAGTGSLTIDTSVGHTVPLKGKTASDLSAIRADSESRTVHEWEPPDSAPEGLAGRSEDGASSGPPAGSRVANPFSPPASTRSVEELTKDKQFEAFLKSHRPSTTVKRLARRRFYGWGAFGMLYPHDEDAPPSITSNRPSGPTGPTAPTTLRYPIDDIEESGNIVRAFLKKYPDRDKPYRTYFLPGSLR